MLLIKFLLAQCDIYFNLLWFKIVITVHYQRFWFHKTQFKCTLSDSTIWQCIHNISSLFYNPFIYKQDLKTNSPNSSWNTVNSLVSGHPQELDKKCPLEALSAFEDDSHKGKTKKQWADVCLLESVILDSCCFQINQQLASPLANFLSRVVFCWFAHWRQIFLPIVNYYWWDVHLQESVNKSKIQCSFKSVHDSLQ